MLPTPRPSSTGGLTSRGTLLLALIGAGLAVSLLFLIPSLNASRAAEPHGRGSRAEHRQEKPTPAAETVELVKPIDIDPEAEEQGQAVTGLATAVTATGAQAQTVVAADTRPRVEGPPLRHLKESGTKPSTVDHHDMRETTRERRKDRKENAAANEPAFGTDQQQTAEDAKVKPRNNPPDRDRLGQRGGKGPKQQGKAKPPKDG